MAEAMLLEQPKLPSVSDRLWTAEEFYKAASAGAFKDPDRLELIHGRLVRRMQGQRHANLTNRLSRRLRRALDPPLFAREEKPVHLAFDSESIPDLMLTYEEEYPGRHPEPPDVALLIEVADTSVDSDLGEKALLYARAGISDYWVVLAEAEVIVVHRNPAPSGYQSIMRLSGEQTISPLTVPSAVWTVNALLDR